MDLDGYAPRIASNRTSVALDRHFAWLLALACALAFGLRAFAGLIGPLGSGAWRIDYDEGVYFSAAAMLARGVLPYRDFVFVHPPGLPLLLAPLAAFGSANAFILARGAAALAGVASTALCGVIARRAWGALAGVAAALVYATYPEAALVEWGVFLEPGLNLLCLASAALWLSPRGRAGLGGLFAGVGCAVKLLGGTWVIAAVLTPAEPGRLRGPLRFLGVAAGAGALLCGPFLLAAPAAMFSDVIAFQGGRPADGTPLLDRFTEIINGRHLVSDLLALFALFAIGARWRRAGRTERYFAITYLLTLGSFLASKSYYDQYNAHLAASSAVLAGCAIAILAEQLARRSPRLASGIPLVLLALVTAMPSRHLLRRSGRRLRPFPELREELASRVPPGAPVLAFEPAAGILANRLPPRLDATPPWMDPYAAMLAPVVAAKHPYPSALEAFADPAAQAVAWQAIDRVDWVILGARGRWQLSPASLQRFEREFEPAWRSDSDLDLWKRRR